MSPSLPQPARQPIAFAPSPGLPDGPVHVLKFGSSVLRGPGDLPKVAGEIYRQRRRGRRVVAVVSALEGETDRLFREAAAVGGQSSCAGVADLVSLGEDRAAALLKLACDRIGLVATIRRAEHLGLVAGGSEVDAGFVAFAPDPIRSALEACDVVIVPGFVGVDGGGARVLLGRGGSDYTAAILGAGLGAECVRLYKDVDGVFERDPAEDPSARRFACLGYADAKRLARQLVHDKAVDHAARHGLTIEVDAIGHEDPTTIGDVPARLADPRPRSPTRIALAGYGVVGQALARRLRDDPNFELTSILVRDPARQRDVPPPAPMTDRPDHFLAADCDVLVELTSCQHTGALLCCEQLRRGRHVVTASKRLISAHFNRLRENERAGSATLRYAAAVGGSAPILETIGQARQSAPVLEVSGILNGTVNFVLHRIAQGMDLAEALAIARDAGFAEEDSAADLSGADAAAKLRIVASAAFDLQPGDVSVQTEPLDEAAASRIARSGERWVQVSTIRHDKSALVATVALRPASQLRFPIPDDEWNLASIRLADNTELVARGRGAGGAATAEAVLADLYALAARPRAASQPLLLNEVRA